MAESIPGGLLDGAVVVESGASWHVIRYPDGRTTIRFKASEATSPNTAKKGGFSGTDETEAFVNPATGKVYVGEGQHRLNAAAVDGKTVGDSVPGSPGWLEYTYKGKTDVVGQPPQWAFGEPHQPNPNNPFEGQEGY